MNKDDLISILRYRFYRICKEVSAFLDGSESKEDFDTLAVDHFGEAFDSQHEPSIKSIKVMRLYMKGWCHGLRNGRPNGQHKKLAKRFVENYVNKQPGNADYVQS